MTVTQPAAVEAPTRRPLPAVRPGSDRTDRDRTDRDRTDRDRVLVGTRALLVGFTLLTALATNQLLLRADRTDRLWAWTIEDRPTAAFLGAAYAAGFLLSIRSLPQRSWAHVRVAVATVAVFTSLTLIATLWHAHRLHLMADDPMARSAAWFWLVVYASVPLACLAVLVRQEGMRRRPSGGRVPLPLWLRRVLTIQAAALVAAGAVLFAGGWVVHHGPVPTAGLWPWPLPPLAAQVTGAWLVALGVGAVLGVRDGDLRRLRVPAVTYTAFGAFELAVLAAFRTRTGGPEAGSWAWWGWSVLLASVALTGAYGWWAASRRPAAAR